MRTSNPAKSAGPLTAIFTATLQRSTAAGGWVYAVWPVSEEFFGTHGLVKASKGVFTFKTAPGVKTFMADRMTASGRSAPTSCQKPLAAVPRRAVSQTGNDSNGLHGRRWRSAAERSRPAISRHTRCAQYQAPGVMSWLAQCRWLTAAQTHV